MGLLIEILLRLNKSLVEFGPSDRSHDYCVFKACYIVCDGLEQDKDLLGADAFEAFDQLRDDR